MHIVVVQTPLVWLKIRFLTSVFFKSWHFVCELYWKATYHTSLQFYPPPPKKKKVGFFWHSCLKFEQIYFTSTTMFIQIKHCTNKTHTHKANWITCSFLIQCMWTHPLSLIATKKWYPLICQISGKEKQDLKESRILTHFTLTQEIF